jgi:TRAP-type C4-dicarboxylate transport system substrate-binding protein
MPRFWISALASLVLLALSCPHAGSATAAEKIVFGHIFEEDTAQHRELLWAAGEIERRLGGRYQLEIFPRGELGTTDAQVAEGFRKGTTDISYFNFGHAAGIYPPLAIGGAPFLFRDFHHWELFRDSALFTELTRDFERAAQSHVLGLAYYGERHISAKKPIAGAADLKGLVIRVPDKPSMITLFRSFGAVPVVLPFNETYQALKEGLVQAEENPLPTIRVMHFAEVTPIITLTRHVTDGELIVISERRWQKFSAADRPVIGEIFTAAAKRISVTVRSDELALVGAFREAGFQVNEIDRQPLVDAVRPILSSGAFPWGADLVARIEALR